MFAGGSRSVVRFSGRPGRTPSRPTSAGVGSEHRGRALIAVTGALSLVLGLLSGVFAPAASAATTFNVATSAQLTAAMSNAVDGDIIAFTGNIVVSGQVTVNKSVTLSGNGFTISVPIPGVSDSGANNSGASAFRVFNVSASKSVTIQNLTIKGGNVQGAGVYNPATATVTLVGVTISNCRSSAAGGGGIYNAGTLYLMRSSLIRNSALFGGGFVNANTGVMYIDGSSISENRSESASGGGGGGENQGSLYANNLSFSNNQSTEIGGGLNNYSTGKLRILNSSFTGNVAYGSYGGGGLGNHGGTANAVVANTVFAYNYRRTGGTSANPTSYALDDFGNAADGVVTGTGVSLAYSTYQAVFPTLATNVTGNHQYVETLATPGTTGTNGATPNVPILFAGGLSAAILAPATGSPIGVSVFRPFLVPGTGIYTGVSVPLLGTGSWADDLANRGTSTRFSSVLNAGLPVMAYYDKSAGIPAWVALTAGSPATSVGVAGDLVTLDQVGTARPDGSAGGAYTTTGAAQLQASDLFDVRSITTATGGSVTGASIYGDVYPAGTSVTVTAVPNSGKQFKEWKVNGISCAVATCPQVYTFAVTANTTLEPVFENVPGGTVTVRVFGDPTSTGPPISGGQTLGSNGSFMAAYSGLVAANAVAVNVSPVCSITSGPTVEASAAGLTGDYTAPLTCISGTLSGYTVNVTVQGGSCLVPAGVGAGVYVVGTAQSSVQGFGTTLPDGSNVQAYRATVGAAPAQQFASAAVAGVYLPAARACAPAAPSTSATATSGGALTVADSVPPINGGAALLTTGDSLGVNGYNRVLAKPTPSGAGGVGGGYRPTYSRCGVTNASPTSVECQLGGPGGVAVTTGGAAGLWNPGGCAGQIVGYRSRYMTLMGYGLWSAEAPGTLTGPCS